MLNKNSPPTSISPPPLLVFSHLRWDFVTQRPQHLISRLTSSYDTYFFEEPVTGNGTAEEQVKLFAISPQLRIVRITAPEINNSAYQQSVTDLVESKLFKKLPILWLYSPAFMPLVKKIPHRLLIYDCMDELSAFAGASPGLKFQEKQLLLQADLVFTGGHSLYESKSVINPATYYFPSSVDIDHFAAARIENLPLPVDMKQISHPVIGFYGVLDERLDLSLIKQIARLMPEVSFVFIGPVVKISPGSLPQAPNIYYLGMKSYADLPQYLQGFDIAFMPFELNKSTRFISPTKTLEYMAALKPIVSTPIKDVVRIYDHQSVTVISSAAELQLAIRRHLHESSRTKAVRIRHQQQILARSSWDQTAQEMSKLITSALRKKIIQREVSIWSTT